MTFDQILTLIEIEAKERNIPVNELLEKLQRLATPKHTRLTQLDLDTRVTSALWAHKVETLEEALALTELDLLRVNRLGEKGKHTLRNWLAKYRE